MRCSPAHGDIFRLAIFDQAVMRSLAPSPLCLTPPNGRGGIRHQPAIDRDHAAFDPLGDLQRASSDPRNRRRRPARIRWHWPARSPLPGRRTGSPPRPGRTPRCRGFRSRAGHWRSPTADRNSLAARAACPPSRTSAPLRDRIGDQPLDLVDRLAVDHRAALRRRFDARHPPSSRPSARPACRRTRRGCRAGRRSGWRRCRPRRALRILAIIAPSIAASRSASSRTRNGALPPSSIDELMTESAASRSSMRPTSVDPVKDSLRTRGSCRIALHTGPGSLVLIDVDDARRHARAAHDLRHAQARSAAFPRAGFRMQVQPAASAGAILRVAIAAGKFHGVISSETPIG